MILDDSVEQRRGNRIALIIGLSLMIILILAMIFI